MTVQLVPDSSPPSNTARLTLPIRGMTCMGCVASVHLALSDLPGVQEVAVDLPTRQAQIAYDPTLVGPAQMAEAVAEAGYAVGEETPPAGRSASPGQASPHPWRRPLFFGLLGAIGLLVLYLGLVSLAQGWTHALELLAGDAWIVGPILAGFGVQVGLYTYLKTAIHAAARGTGALAGAGGGTSTAAMVACCAHHVTDVLPLVGLSAAATFLAEYRIPFMLVGLVTNLMGIGVIGFLILRQRRRLAESVPQGQTVASAPARH
ncbi:MAG: heavy-metal-associated domain-containing protein [Anaerolineae bacterium]